MSDEEQERVEVIVELNRENARLRKELSIERTRVEALEEDVCRLVAELDGGS